MGEKSLFPHRFRSSLSQTFKRASRDCGTWKPWIPPHSGNFKHPDWWVQEPPAGRSVGCPHGFLSMIFGFLGKFRIDIEKNPSKNKKFQDQKSLSKKSKNIFRDQKMFEKIYEKFNEKSSKKSNFWNFDFSLVFSLIFFRTFFGVENIFLFFRSKKISI